MAQSLTRNRKATESSKKKSNAGGRAGNLTRRKAPVAKREKNDESVGRRKGSDHMPTKGRKKTKKKKGEIETKTCVVYPPAQYLLLFCYEGIACLQKDDTKGTPRCP